MSAVQTILKPVYFLRSNIFMFFITGLLIFGWTRRDDNYLSAETGTGYMLGILGGSMMLILLLYPISKRIKLMTRWIPIRYWFGIHMMLGVVGPVMILFHSNYHLGSINSTIALVSMLLVAGSGLIGRYIYTHIHHGLYGTRITLAELKQETGNNYAELLNTHAMDEHLNAQLSTMEEKALQPYTGLFTSLQQVIYLATNSQRLKRKLKPLLANNEGKSLLASINRYTLALRRTAAFKLYERLFSLWHILHLPLFIMMIITAVIHVFAVHMY